MLMPTVNYLLVVGCEHVEAKGVERNEERLQDRPPKQQKKPMKVYLCNNKLRNQPPKKTNSTSTAVTSESAQRSKMIAKKQGCHSIAPADKQMNEEMVHPASPHHLTTLHFINCIIYILCKEVLNNLMLILKVSCFLSQNTSRYLIFENHLSSIQSANIYVSALLCSYFIFYFA